MLNLPNHLILHLGTVCNYKCIFCNNPRLSAHAPVSLESINRYESLFNIVDLVDISGYGEAICNPDFRRIVAMLTEKKKRFSFSTNGFGLTKEIITLLHQSTLSRINVSINSLDEAIYSELCGGSGNLPAVLENLEALRQGRKFELTISMVVTSKNIHEMPAFVRFGADKDVDEVRLLAMTPHVSYASGLEITGTVEDQRYFLEAQQLASWLGMKISGLSFDPPEVVKQRLVTCRAPWTQIVIGPNGEVTPCCWKCHTIMGNVLQEDWRDIWNNEKYRDMRDCISRGDPRHCLHCKEFG
jgi:MoaA/NifB/PqqE/SkfB family radical SAM enzyme